MQWFHSLIVQNFILLCISLIVIVNSIQNIKQNKKVSVYSISIIGLTLFLALAATLEDYSKSILNPSLTLVWSVLGYVLRPVALYLFLLMVYKGPKGKWFPLTVLPLVINLAIFILAFIPATGSYVVSYYINDIGTLSFSGGPLRFSSHIIAALYLVALFAVAISQIRLKHLSDSVGIMTCGLFVIFAVLIETFMNSNGDIYLLNTSIGLSVLTYFIFAYIEQNQTDALTGLFTRATYYRDLPRMEKELTGVIQYDLNGLKYLNDNVGHQEGDKALATVSRVILKSCSRKMYAYRMGGDEFMTLAYSLPEEVIVASIAKFKEELAKTPYHCSIGYAYRNDPSTSADDLMKDAEARMYEDKEAYYKNGGIERRKALKP